MQRSLHDSSPPAAVIQQHSLQHLLQAAELDQAVTAQTLCYMRKLPRGNAHTDGQAGNTTINVQTADALQQTK
jgi:hypothetical protein